MSIVFAAARQEVNALAKIAKCPVLSPGMDTGQTGSKECPTTGGICCNYTWNYRHMCAFTLSISAIVSHMIPCIPCMLLKSNKKGEQTEG